MLSKILERFWPKKRVYGLWGMDLEHIAPPIVGPYIRWDSEDSFHAFGFDSPFTAIDFVKTDPDIAGVKVSKVLLLSVDGKPVFSGEVTTRYSRGQWAMGPDMIARRIPR